MLFASAANRLRSSASFTSASVDTRVPRAITSADCSRDSSIISRTSAESRCDSRRSLPVKYSIACGSSDASSIASASRPIAPTGVFSSCETLATKSLRTRCTREISVRSSASTSMYSSPTGATRRSMTSVSPSPRSTSTSCSTKIPRCRTVRIISDSCSETTVCPRTRPIA